MARVLVPLFVAAFILLVDAPRLVRERLWGELLTHGLLTTAATVIIILDGQGVDIPNVVAWIRDQTQPMGEATLGWLGPGE